MTTHKRNDAPLTGRQLPEWLWAALTIGLALLVLVAVVMVPAHTL